MQFVRRLLGCQAARSPKRSPSRRLQVEGLEARVVLTVTPHGGAVLPHVEVQGLYIGDQWSSNPTLNGQSGYLEGFLNNIVHSSYMTELTNAGYGVGQGSFKGGKISLASLASGSTLNDSTIRSWLSSYVGNQTLQSPDANTLYVCFVEPNVLVKQADGSTSTGFRGYHTAFAGPNGSVIRYAVIAYPGGATNNGSVSFLSSIDSITKTASHEIAEAATDPDIGYGKKGWYDDAKNGEIGDINNNRVVYVNGYAMQRVIDQNDFVMTPAQANSNRPVNFVLQGNGNVVEITSAGSTALAGSIVYLSEQGIDNQGHAMVDIVDTLGRAWEYHDTVGWTYLGSGVKNAVAGQGVSYILYTNGNVYEFDDATSTTSFIDSSAVQISAGSDAHGVNAVDIVYSFGSAWEHSDSSGWHFIASGVKSVSAGRQGISDYVTTASVARWHSEAGNQDVFLANGVTQVAAGTDSAGNYVIDLLYTTGSVQEYRIGKGWIGLTSGVKSLSKGPLDAIDFVFSNKDAWQYTATGWKFLKSDTLMAA